MIKIIKNNHVMRKMACGHLSRILVLCLLLGLFSVGVFAMESENSVVICTKEEADVYIGQEKYPDAPVGKVFGGWYQDAQYEIPYTGNEDIEYAYARYVDESVLSVKCQITAGTSYQSKHTDLRLITTVDSLNYQQVGFEVTIRDRMNPLVSNTVYKVLNGYNAQNKTIYQPTVFSEESEYFMAHTLTNIPQSFFLETITVVPKWITMDGTAVTGVSRSFTINEVIGNDNTELLLAFDSYEEITKTSIRMGNQFGKTAVNQDEQFLTEGKASWMVRPQGDYGKENAYPYFWMQCLKDDYTTGFRKSDFCAYDKILMDVYNDSDEEIQFKWNFTVWNASKRYVETEAVIWALRPHVWTTCSFDLSGEEYTSHYRLESVKYMKISFLTQKENKDDITPVLYLDNLRGHISEEERVFTEFEYDMQEGLTFEPVLEQYAVSGTDLSDVRRVSYAEAGLKPLNETMGEYVLSGDATGSVHPRFLIDYAKTYEAGAVLSFWLYVEVDETVAENRLLRLNQINSGEEPDIIYQSAYQYNHWIQVKVILGRDAEQSRFFVDFDNNASGISIWDTEEPIKIYMDNVHIGGQEKDVVENADGSVTLRNPYWDKSSLIYNIGMGASAGSTISFDVAFSSGAKGGVWILGDADWENVFYETNPFGGRRTINAEIKTDVRDIQIYIGSFEEADDGTEYTVTISNLEIYRYRTSEGLTFERTGHMDAVSQSWEKPEISRVSYADTGILPLDDSMGEYVLQVDGTGAVWPGIIVDYGKTYEAGMVLNFMLYVEVDENAIKDKLVDIQSKNGVIYTVSSDFNQWIEVKMKLTADAEQGEFFINFDDTGDGNSYLKDSESVKIYLDNIWIGKVKEVEENADGTVTLLNPYNQTALSYNIGQAASAGSYISFEIELSEGVCAAVWNLGDGDWNAEFSATDDVTGKTAITAKITKDVSDIQIYLLYKDDAADKTKYTATISNLKISKSDISEGFSFEKQSDLDKVLMFNNCTFNRVNYEAEGIIPYNGSMGDYGLKFVTQELSESNSWMKYYPGLYVDLGREYKEGTALEFWMYVKTDEKALKNQKVKIHCNSNEDNSKWNYVEQESDQFNDWIRVMVTLRQPAEKLQIFVNLENYSVEDEKWGSIYLDNIQLSGNGY